MLSGCTVNSTHQNIVKSIRVSSRPCCSQFAGAYNLTFTSKPHLHPASDYANVAGATHADSHLNPCPHRWMTSCVYTSPTSGSRKHCRRMSIMPQSFVCLGCRLSLCVRMDTMKLTYHTADCARYRPMERGIQFAGWPPRACNIKNIRQVHDASISFRIPDTNRDIMPAMIGEIRRLHVRHHHVGDA